MASLRRILPGFFLLGCSVSKFAKAGFAPPAVLVAKASSPISVESSAAPAVTDVTALRLPWNSGLLELENEISQMEVKNSAMKQELDHILQDRRNVVGLMTISKLEDSRSEMMAELKDLKAEVKAMKEMGPRQEIASADLFYNFKFMLGALSIGAFGAFLYSTVAIKLLEHGRIRFRSTRNVTTPFDEEMQSGTLSHTFAPRGPAPTMSTSGGLHQPCNMNSDESELDRSKLEQSFDVQALQVPCRRTDEFMKKLTSHLLNITRRRNVERGPTPGVNLLLLSKNLGSIAALPSLEKDWVNLQLSQSDVRLTTYTVHLTYDNFSAEEVLSKLLPNGIEIPSSFEQAGHVCHLNLRDSQLPYRHLIAQVILDKNKSVKTVVNKTGKIETEFRTFPMEHLAGEASTVVRLKEKQCWFQFEYRDVYWNSRLQDEHGRLIDALFIDPVLKGDRPRPVLADCTCGIGPFSVPVVKQALGTVSHANDLNPASIQWLTQNAEINKLPHVTRVAGVPPYTECFAAPESGSKLIIHEPGDARDFIRGLFQGLHPVTHALFNLPATGIELLDVFRALDYEAQGLPSPLVFCYTFSDAVVDSADDNGCVADLLHRLAVSLDVPRESLIYLDCPDNPGLPLPSPQVAQMVCLADTSPSLGTAVAIRLIRNVTPTRHMFCVSFRVPKPASNPPKTKKTGV